MGLMDKLKKFLMETETKDDNLFKNNQDKIPNEPIVSEEKEEEPEVVYEFNQDRELYARKIEVIKKVVEGIPAFNGCTWDLRDDIDAYETQTLNETMAARLEDDGYISISVADDEISVMFSYGKDCKDLGKLQDALQAVELPANTHFETYEAPEDGTYGVAFYYHNIASKNPIKDADQLLADTLKQLIGLCFKALQGAPASSLFGI